MFRLRSLTVLLAAVTFVVAGASTSIAETVADRDLRHDVQRYDVNGEQVVPRHANGDIVRHRISYGGGRLRAVIRFAELRRRVPVMWVGVPVMWPEGGGDFGHGEMEVEVHRDGAAQGAASFYGSDVECKVRSLIRYDANTVRLSMPSRCIGAPRWIRAYTAAYTDFPGRHVMMVDTSPDNLTGRPGARIRRG